MEPAVYDAAQVTELLRLKSVRVANDLAAKGDLPAFKVGRHWRFPIVEIQALLNGGRVVKVVTPRVGRPRTLGLGDSL